MGETTRDRLTAAAAEVIVERGWGGVTTRNVAERAGVGPGVVHYHFGSVDGLKRTAAMAALGEIIRPWLADAERLPPREIIRAVATASVEEYGPDTAVGALVHELILAAARDHVLQAELLPPLEEFRRLLADQIRRWHPDPHVDPAVLAELIGAAIDGLQLHLLIDRELDVVRHLEPLLALMGREVRPADLPHEDPP